MRRKTTLLENNLIDLGFRLDHKTYSGRKSDKVSGYVYAKCNGFYEYYVYLNRERNQIDSYGFQEPFEKEYNIFTLTHLQETYKEFENLLKEIYDFEKQEAILKEKVDLSVDFVEEYPFVEESVFDD